MAKVRIQTKLPVSAEAAFERAHRLETFEHVIWPVIGLGMSDAQREEITSADQLNVGDEFAARLWFFKVIPAWQHTIKIVGDGATADGALELSTNERSGPIHTWNHQLNFRPTGDNSCVYTDSVEIKAGPLTVGTALFAKVFYRYRQWRWRRLVV